MAGVCRYSCTKWAGEVLMRQACEQLGLPVTAYRCAMILAHTQCATTSLLNDPVKERTACPAPVMTKGGHGTWRPSEHCSDLEQKAATPLRAGTPVRSTQLTSSRGCWLACATPGWRPAASMRIRAAKMPTSTACERHHLRPSAAAPLHPCRGCSCLA